MKDETILNALAIRYERKGDLDEAWRVTAELAWQCVDKPKHPVHDRLLQLERRMQQRLSKPEP